MSSDPFQSEHSARPLIVVLGPTASGKTDLALHLAAEFNGAIINADSRQIYCYMDIGTAKPTPEQRAAAPHHLIDIVTPDQTFTLAEYQRVAYTAIDAAHAQGQLPLLVGGTGQYITAVIEGWGIPEVPPDPALRAELEALAAAQGNDALHAQLRAVDPDSAERIDARNVRRVVRALEIFRSTGRTKTDLETKTPPPYQVLTLGLTMPREQLYARADTRVDRMVAAGLLDEVRNLLERGYTWDCPAMSGLGYWQWRAHLAGEESAEDAITAIRHATHAFIRRQYTWFNGHGADTRWLDTAQTPPETALGWAAQWLSHAE